MGVWRTVLQRKTKSKALNICIWGEGGRVDGDDLSRSTRKELCIKDSVRPGNGWMCRDGDK